MYARSHTKLLTLVLGGVTSVLSLTLTSCRNRPQAVGGAAEETFVAVTQLVERPALNAIRDGVKDELAAAGYEAGKTLRWEWQSAKGSPLAATHIAEKYAGARPDVIVAIAPRSAQTVAAATSNTPIVFSAVSDPIEAKLVTDIQKPGGNISGVRDTSPTHQQIELIQEILPNLKTLGVVYGVDDDNLMSPSLRINDIALDLGIDAEVLTVLTPEDAIVAANSLTGSVDAIYIPGGDQTVAGALDDIIQSGKDNQVPVFGGDVEAVEKGAIATVSFDYYDIGRQTGAMVVKVLRGNRPSDLAIEGVKDLKISVNPTAAATMGVTLPDSVTSRATITIPSPPNTP